MLKAAIEKITELAQSKTYQIGKDTYSDRQLFRIKPHVDRPELITVSGLDSLVKLINTEKQRIGTRIYVRVTSHNRVDVFTTYQDDYSRNDLYVAKSDTPEFYPEWMDFETAMITFRSKFEQSEGTEYILSLLSRISDENSVATNDNGLTQSVEAKKGIALNAKEVVKPRVKLRPYRTFLEIEQPESEFLVRLREGGQIGLFEADGGMWKLEAKRSIKEYFEKAFTSVDLDKNITIMI